MVAAGGAQTPRGRALTPGSATRRTVAEQYGNRDVVAITFVSVGMVVDVDVETVTVATTVVGVGEATNVDVAGSALLGSSVIVVVAVVAVAVVGTACLLYTSPSPRD